MLLLEPCGKNTAPALTLAALYAKEFLKETDDPVFIVAPADQTLTNIEAFQKALVQAIETALDGRIVTLGIQPERPETRYGYIDARGDETVKTVHAFVEKPNMTLAEAYLENNNYYWNSGIFVLKASTWIKALSKYRSDILDAVHQSWLGKKLDHVFIRPDAQDFQKIPGESIDYAVMEPCSSDQEKELTLNMIALDAAWSDLARIFHEV